MPRVRVRVRVRVRIGARVDLAHSPSRPSTL